MLWKCRLGREQILFHATFNKTSHCFAFAADKLETGCFTVRIHDDHHQMIIVITHEFLFTEAELFELFEAQLLDKTCSDHSHNLGVDVYIDDTLTVIK